MALNMIGKSETLHEEVINILNLLFTTVFQEVIHFVKRFPEAEIYISKSEPFLYLEVVYDYSKLSEEDKEYFFGFEYRLNKKIKSAIDKDFPYIEVNFVKKLEQPKDYIKVT